MGFSGEKRLLGIAEFKQILEERPRLR